MNRKLNWVSSIDSKNKAVIEELKNRLYNFYNNQNYYTEIDFTSNNWADLSLLHYKEIASKLVPGKKILEVGRCKANILNHFPHLQPSYTGIDFSEVLMKENKARFPEANFFSITSSNEFPVNSVSYDVVFSVFVLEHTVYPKIFLDECSRVLKKNGLLIILTPDFLGRSRMSSQRFGFSTGSGRQKFQQRKYFDSLITAFDNKIKIPLYALYLRTLCALKPRFYINLNPTCFTDDFYPDADAVYLTYEKEIKKYLSTSIYFITNSTELKKYLKKIQSILLIGKKN